MKITDYADARPRMKPGDVMAFSGKGHFSEIIKFATRAEVSHVGVILQRRIAEKTSGRYFNEIIESTTLLNGIKGVQTSRLSDRLTSYDGNIWWLPLRNDIRTRPRAHTDFYDFLFNSAKEQTPYDMPQAIGSALDALDGLGFRNSEDFSKFFCSELVAAALEVAGVVGSVNASEVTPIDLCRWDIYEDDYYHLKGDPPREISRFNTLDSAAWA